MALVVQITVRISLSKASNGTISAQAFSHNLRIARYFRPSVEQHRLLAGPGR
jgi:hypothetical protein